jgi:hypothetical protein
MNKSILSFEKERILVSCKPGAESAAPSPVLAQCTRIETIPYSDGNYYATPLDAATVGALNEQMYEYLRSYIKEVWPGFFFDSNPTSPSYNINPEGWVYLESVDTETDTFFEKVEGGYTAATLYLFSARIVFYTNNNTPSVSPSGV